MFVYFVENTEIVEGFDTMVSVNNKYIHFHNSINVVIVLIN